MEPRPSAFCAFKKPSSHYTYTYWSHTYSLFKNNTRNFVLYLFGTDGFVLFMLKKITVFTFKIVTSLLDPQSI